MDDRARLLSLIDKHGLATYRDVIAAAALPSLRIHTESVSEADIPIGSSKIGGSPDFPPSLETPVVAGLPLPFIAQINLEQVGAALPIAPSLPQRGILYFFYEVNPTVAQAETGDGARLPWLATTLFYDGDLSLVARTSPPEALKSAPYSACSVTFTSELTIPACETVFVEKTIGVSWDEMVADHPVANGYLALYYEYCGRYRTCIHRWLGHPDPIQGDVFYGAVLYPSWEQTGTPVYDRPDFAEWMLMLQVDTDDNAQMMWSDIGCLYFCIKRSDWENKRFDRMVCETQSN